jgi:hypothetical protein
MNMTLFSNVAPCSQSCANWPTFQRCLLPQSSGRCATSQNTFSFEILQSRDGRCTAWGSIQEIHPLIIQMCRNRRITCTMWPNWDLPFLRESLPASYRYASIARHCFLLTVWHFVIRGFHVGYSYFWVVTRKEKYVLLGDDELASGDWREGEVLFPL